MFFCFLTQHQTLYGKRAQFHQRPQGSDLLYSPLHLRRNRSHQQSANDIAHALDEWCECHSWRRHHRGNHRDA